MLEIESLTKRFDTVTAVAGLSLAVKPGEVLGFLGPNGAGKTTTMKMVTGFLVPDGGTARIGGHDIVTDTIAAQRKMGYLPEGAPSYGEMTPREFLGFVAEVRGLKGGNALGARDVAVGHTGLGPVLDRPIETLSKGFRRRVGLAQAILHDPEVLILDEPTDGLDPNQKHAVRELIRAIAPTKTIVISTHLLEEVDAVCTRAVIITHGRIVADGTPRELMAMSPTGKLDDLFRSLTTSDRLGSEGAAA
jgi:ABC-2 type transport system ATP-binding protein